MSNPNNLSKHEIAELLADLDEAASFLRTMALTGGSAMHMPIFQEDASAFRRWAQSIDTVSRMVEVK